MSDRFDARAAQFGRDAASRPALTEPLSIETSGITWLAVHGTICLGLRHPAYRGPSRPFVVNFVRELGQRLVAAGLLTREELELVERTEQVVSPHGAL